MKKLFLCAVFLWGTLGSFGFAQDFNPLEILEIPQGASVAEIKDAFRRKVKATHPDLNADAAASSDFVRVKEAFDLLKARQFDTFFWPAPKVREISDQELEHDFEEALVSAVHLREEKILWSALERMKPYRQGREALYQALVKRALAFLERKAEQEKDPYLEQWDHALAFKVNQGLCGDLLD
jgi:hypothetical protein